MEGLNRKRGISDIHSKNNPPYLFLIMALPGRYDHSHF